MPLRKILAPDDILMLTVSGAVIKIALSGKRRDKDNGTFYYENAREPAAIMIDAPPEVAISTMNKSGMWIGGVRKAASRP